ncbi:hypothetical protein D9M71_661350 [compost metagenome]
MHGGRQAEQLGAAGIQYLQGGVDASQVHRQVVAQLAAFGQQASGGQWVDVQVLGIHHLGQVRQRAGKLLVQRREAGDAAHPHRPVGRQVVVDGQAHGRSAGDGGDRSIRQLRLHDAQDLAEGRALDNGQV